MTALKIVIGNKRYSSWSLRGWLAVRHTGLEVDEILLPLDTPEFYREIAKYSPAKRVPTLLHGDTAVWDSAAIVDYCARLAPEKYWWPEDMDAYGHARAIFNEMHSGFTHIRNHMPMNLNGRWNGLLFGPVLQKEIDRVQTLFHECRTKYGTGGDFLLGDFSAVDMMFAPVVTRLDTYGARVNKTVQAYMDAVLAYPSMVAWREAAMKETDIVEIDQLPSDIKRLG